METFWTVVITILCVVQLVGMVWAWRWIPAKMVWQKRLVMAFVWPVVWIAYKFAVVQ